MNLYAFRRLLQAGWQSRRLLAKQQLPARPWPGNAHESSQQPDGHCETTGPDHRVTSLANNPCSDYQRRTSESASCRSRLWGTKKRKVGDRVRVFVGTAQTAQAWP